jgi:uncharacterized membrane protein
MKLRMLLICVSVTLFLSSTGVAQVRSYRLEKLIGPAYPPKNILLPAAINNRGAMAGTMNFGVIDPGSGRPTAAFRGYKQNADGVFVYPIIGPGDYKYITRITGLNELGMMTGWNSFGFNQLRGFLYDGEKFTVVDYMPSGSTKVQAINNRNHYAGNFGPNGIETAFLVVDGKATQFAIPGAIFTGVFGLAWDDTIVGTTSINGQPFAYLRGPQGRIRTFSIAGASTTVPYAINNNVGLIVGGYSTPDGREHGFIYDYLRDPNPGPIIPVTTIDYPRSYSTRITSINASGVIVGTSDEFNPEDLVYRPIAFIGRPQ